MATQLSTKARNAACDAIVDLADEGAGAGKLKIKDGTTVLCTITEATGIVSPPWKGLLRVYIGL